MTIQQILETAFAHYQAGRATEAERLCQQVLTADPNHPDALHQLGLLYHAIGQHALALEYYQKAIQLRPDFAAANSNRICLLNLCPEYDSQMLLRRNERQWNQRHAEPFRPAQIPRKTNSSSRRLRIGYVSADFRNHAVARNILPLLREFDRRQFEIFCYSNNDQPDAMTAKLRAQADNWRSIVRMNDAAGADLIRTDNIDILVDLSLHTPGNRLQLFARKPALPCRLPSPVIPAGTGLTAMDWRLTDPYLDPPGVGDENYVERSYRLPDSFWCYDPTAMQWDPDGTPPPEVTELPAQSNGYITFGCLNNFCKVNEKVLSVWGQTLAKVQNSRLLMLAPEGSSRARALDLLYAAGISTDRIEFVGQQSRSKYLREFHRIDIALDTFPYNGHTTSLDAMWMGVPVISRLGQTVAGRAGWSHASNLGLTDLVADSDEQFTDIAVRYSADLPALAELRRTLRQRMLSSPLCNARRFAENIQTAYRKIWAE